MAHCLSCVATGPGLVAAKARLRVLGGRKFGGVAPLSAGGAALRVPRLTRRGSVVASLTLALLVGAAPAAHAGSSSRAAGSPVPVTADGQTPPIPDGFALSDFVSDAGFASGVSGFTPGSVLDGAVGLDTTDPLDGSSSLHVTLNAFGRVSLVAQFPFGGGPMADSVTVAGKLRVNSSVPA